MTYHGMQRAEEKCCFPDRIPVLFPMLTTTFLCADSEHLSGPYHSEDPRATEQNYHEIFNRTDRWNQFQCKLCGKFVTNRWHHYHSHRPQNTQCPICRLTFTRKDNMKAHLKMQHASSNS